MSEELEQIISELEQLTARMSAETCWERIGEFAELSASRRLLAAQLMQWHDLDAQAAERIAKVIQSGNGLMAQTMAMRASVASAIAETKKQRRFTGELRGAVECQARWHRIDLQA